MRVALFIFMFKKGPCCCTGKVGKSVRDEMDVRVRRGYNTTHGLHQPQPPARLHAPKRWTCVATVAVDPTLCLEWCQTAAPSTQHIRMAWRGAWHFWHVLEWRLWCVLPKRVHGCVRVPRASVRPHDGHTVSSTFHSHTHDEHGGYCRSSRACFTGRPDRTLSNCQTAGNTSPAQPTPTAAPAPATAAMLTWLPHGLPRQKKKNPPKLAQPPILGCPLGFRTRLQSSRSFDSIYGPFEICLRFLFISIEYKTSRWIYTC
jgi:hypothetical protein